MTKALVGILAGITMGALACFAGMVLCHWMGL